MDTTYGTAGKVTPPFPIADMALQADGIIVIVGTVTGCNGWNRMAVARFDSSGALDPTFGNEGQVAFDYGQSSDEARSVAIQNDGRIVIVGRTMDVTGSRPTSMSIWMAVNRLMPDGSFDTSFGTGGKFSAPAFNVSAIGEAVAILPDGRIAVAGEVNYFNQSDALLLLLNSNGTPDTNLNGSGFNTLFSPGGTPPPSSPTFIHDMAIQQDGKMIIVGSTKNGCRLAPCRPRRIMERQCQKRPGGFAGKHRRLVRCQPPGLPSGPRQPLTSQPSGQARS